MNDKHRRERKPVSTQVLGEEAPGSITELEGETEPGPPRPDVTTLAVGEEGGGGPLRRILGAFGKF